MKIPPETQNEQTFRWWDTYAAPRYSSRGDICDDQSTLPTGLTGGKKAFFAETETTVKRIKVSFKRLTQ